MAKKTFMVPAFIIVEAESAEKADQGVLNALRKASNDAGLYLYLDEGIPTMEVPNVDIYTSVLEYHVPEVSNG